MAKQKQPERVQFALTSPIWLGSERLPKGHVVTFENDEPTGVYKGRCKPLSGEIAAPAASPELAEANARAVAAEKERDELAEKLAEAEKALAAAKPPAPPA